MKNYRIAIVLSHPIQHFCPQFISWSTLTNVTIKVFFSSRHGLDPYQDNGFGRVIKWDGIKLEFPHEFLENSCGKEVNASIDSPDLAKRLKVFFPNVVIVYGYAQALQRRALRWADSENIPVFMISDSVLRVSNGWLKDQIKSFALPIVFKKVRIFLTVGDANEAYYRKYGALDDQLIRCFFPIDICHYDTILATRDRWRNYVRSMLDIPEHHRVILMVGKLVPSKRQIDLIRFSNSIQGNQNNVTVLLVGSGQDEAKLHSQALKIGAGGVLFAGFVPPEMLARYYCAADVYVHCSAQEAHSLAISEAIYCGLPVIISNKCGSYGPTDDVQHGHNGLVYQCGNLDNMTMRLTYVLDDPSVRKRMSDASVRLGLEHQAKAHGLALNQALTVIDS